MGGSAKFWSAVAVVLTMTWAVQPVSSGETKNTAGAVAGGAFAAGTLIAELPDLTQTEPVVSLPSPGTKIVPPGMLRNDYTTIRYFCRTLRPQTRDLLLSCR